ncbi:MAG: DUF3127 domain-containing protein [Candidatus Shikimatogenerans bostrichidophilus]|nr:MAG: DUF3127 domain-containing protein [Candidatus Shikimatogenerans bostrichidophilus]
MYLIGRIKDILDIQIFKNNFKKKSIVLLTDEQYPQSILIDFIQDKIELLNYIKKNDKVKIFINIKGREWINQDGFTRYFNIIQGWKIEKIKNENLFEINSDYIKIKDTKYSKKYEDNEDEDNNNEDEDNNNEDEDNNNEDEYNKKKDKKKNDDKKKDNDDNEKIFNEKIKEDFNDDDLPF